MSKYRITGFGLRADFPIDGGKFPLILAAREGNVGKLRNLIAEGVDVNDETPYEETALGWAKSRNHKEMVKILKKSRSKIMKAQVIPIKSRLFKINKVTKKRQRLSDNKFRDLSYVIRANDRTRYISGKALDVATNFHKMLQKHPEKKKFVDQAFLSNITKITTSGGNANIMWQLDDIFVREYHDAVYFDGEIKRWGYIVGYTEDGEERINNPSKFYKMDSLFRPATNSDAGANKLRPRSQKNLTLSIYKELIEDIPQGYISSINEESTTEESIGASLEKTIETSPDAALPNLRGSSTGEFLPQPLESQEFKPVDPAKTTKPRLVITAAMQQGTAKLPLPLQASGLAVGEVNTITSKPVAVPVPLLTAEQEHDREKEHQTRRQETVSDEPKPIGATILSLLPKLGLEVNSGTNTHQKGVDFQSEVETLPSYGTLEPSIDIRVEQQIEGTELTPEQEEKIPEVHEHEEWQKIKQNIVEAYEHPADKIEVRSFLNGLEATEDVENKVINLSGSSFEIGWIKKRHFKPFAASFYKTLPDYTFQFKEIK